MATVSRPSRPFNTTEMQQRVRHPLQSVRGTIRRYVLLEGFLLAVLYLSIGFWIGLGLDFGLFYLFRFDWLLELQEATGNSADVWFRAIVLTLFVIGLGVIVTRKVFFRLFREFSDESVALLLEKRFPRQLGDRLITAVELADPRRAEKYGFSGDMLRKTIEDAADRVEAVPVRKVFNWGRLWKLGLFASLTTIGMYLIAMIVGMVCIAASPSANLDAAGNPIGGARVSSMGDWFGRFNGVVGDWFQREVFLQDDYWLRDAYVELIRFQDTPKHPGAMHVGSKDVRPDLHVKAFRWVHADPRPAREYKTVTDEAGERTRMVRNHFGWRPLVWSDLSGIIDADLLQKAQRIPPDWHGWVVEVDDLDPVVPKHLAPMQWQGKTLGDVRANLLAESLSTVSFLFPFSALAAEKNTSALERLAALKQDDYRAAADRMFDWTTWTLDRIEMQLQRHELRASIGRHREPFEALEQIFARLQQHVADTDNRGTVRMLEVPDTVRFFYRGEKTANPPENEHEQIKDRGLWQRKYLLPLNDLDETVSFHVRAADYSTATKKVVLVPPTAVRKLTLQLQEPAYIHHRVGGNPFLLRGKKQVMADQTSSLGTDSSTSTITVKYGSDLKLIAETDRPLKGKVIVTVPQKPEDKSAFLPPSDPLLIEGGKKFTMLFPHVVNAYEFVLEFNDEDNVKGSRRFLIRPKADEAPEIFDVNLAPFFRRPVIKKDSKDGTGPQLVELPIDAFLITPDAELPIKANFKDDYGLTQAYYKFEVQPVEFELSGDAGQQVRAPMVLGGPSSSRRPLLIGTALQFLPDSATPLGMSAYLAGVNQLVEMDLKNGPQEGKVDFVTFSRRMAEIRLGDPNIAELERKLGAPTPSKEMVRDFQMSELDYFFLPQYLKKLKSADPQKEGQLHYQLKISVEAVDSNIETGPGVSTSKTTFTFLVVSENELLAQIALQEETLRDKLEGAEEKVRDAETILRDLQKRFEGRDPVGLEAMIQRGEDASSYVSKAASSIRDVEGAYNRIFMEMKYNNVRRDRQGQLLENILDPLQAISKPGGELLEVEKAYQELIARLEAAKRAGAAHDREHAALAKEAVGATERLADRLSRIISAMQSEIVFARSLELLISIERRQREAVQELSVYHGELVRKLIDDLK